MNFALVGAAGFVAPRHLQAIHDTGNKLVAAVDPHDAVGVLDKYGYDTAYFTDFHRFCRHLERTPADWVSVCSPNWLHDVHAIAGLRAGSDVICEKPLALSPWNLDAMAEVERKTGKQIFTVLQLRLHPKLLALKETLANHYHTVKLDYVTPRGKWYSRSWKADVERSGGLTTNIGVHLFDTLMWLFGGAEKVGPTYQTPTRAGGQLELKRAAVDWRLSIDPNDGPSRRELTINGGEPIELDGFTGLHTRVYEETLAGRGFTIEDARPAVELTYHLRQVR